MNSNKIINLSNPQRDNEPVTKQYGNRTYLADSGFVMNDNIGINTHMITNLGTPTNNTDATTKKYVHDKRCVFKDGTTSISMVSLRDTGLNGSVELYNNITFDAGAYCQNINSSSPSKAIVNKNTLETEQLITMQSLSPALTRIFQTAVKKKLLVFPSSHTVIYKDPSVNGNLTFTSDSSSVTLDVGFSNDLTDGICKYVFDLILPTSTSIKVFFCGECGGTGYTVNSWYSHWNNGYHGSGATQNDTNGGYFHRGYGTNINFIGEFRLIGGRIVNFGKCYAIKETGAYNEFVIQRVTIFKTD